jgi:hypothetical protein
MLKELQEKIKLEVERMQSDLVTIIKGIINEEKVYAQISEDLSNVTVFVIREKKEETRLIQDEYIFILRQLEDRVSRVIDFDSNVVLFRGNKIMGSYSTNSAMEIEVAQVIFDAMEKFRNDELNKEKDEEAKPVE